MQTIKKILATGIGILFILAILFFTSNSNNYAHAGNDDEEFEYEYYYNNNNSGEDDMETNQTMAPADNERQDDKSISLDIEPDSISVFVNKEYPLPESYIPDNLVIPEVNFYGSGNTEKKHMRKEAAEALEKMFSDAEDDDIILYGVSAYRSYQRQKYIYDQNVRNRGSNVTNKVSAYPGHSEHQTGLAIDISCKSINCALTESFGDTEEGRWVAENCYQYGFIIRYPRDAENITGYTYEPWHIRYVGTEISEYIHRENITLEDYYGYTLDEYYLDNIISDATAN